MNIQVAEIILEICETLGKYNLDERDKTIIWSDLDTLKNLIEERNNAKEDNHT